MINKEIIIEQTKKWINDVVIGCNFCPFAAKEVKRGSIHYEILATTNLKEILEKISFAFLYLAIAAYFGFDTPRDFMLFGAMIGFAHGLIFSIMTVVLVAEHHPIHEFRSKGFSVVAAEGFAHVLYGVTVGATAGFFGVNLQAMSHFGAGLT